MILAQSRGVGSRQQRFGRRVLIGVSVSITALASVVFVGGFVRPSQAFATLSAAGRTTATAAMTTCRATFLDTVSSAASDALGREVSL
eukprot:CAMPEP_0172403198 /NCGR_PEP_ID=MMETSP1061-20121228/58216_1 /TAXON_ID=37318 /ORGANISM="Pseudo-nitzschia pungens, Strain cf. pungens" /LENGTH=87 /DNA_ID=CAMNT_0013137503 /DNA_START=52 /DNA_END=312 /DNA_ORIENTATION=+